MIPPAAEPAVSAVLALIDFWRKGPPLRAGTRPEGGLFCFMEQERSIIHIDMDAFFASVEQRDNPSLRGRPVIIGADPKGGHGRGVVSTCSYEARRFGVRSAMPVSQAYRLCPKGVFLPCDFRRYSEASRLAYGAFYEFTPDVEPVGIDEAFMDVTGTRRLFGPPEEVCRKIKARVRELTGLSCSAGLGPNKIIAKIASDFKKPDGLVCVSAKDAAAFLAPLAVSRMPGVGPYAKEKLESAGLHRLGDIAAAPAALLERLFGSHGAWLIKAARGLDDRPLLLGEAPVSVSHETTFETDTDDEELLEAELRHLSEKVAARLRGLGVLAFTVTVKIRLAGFETHTRAASRVHPTAFPDDVATDALRLLRAFDRRGRLVRLIGVKASSFTTLEQGLLFEDGAARARKKNLYRTVDEICGRFGRCALQSGSGLLYSKKRDEENTDS